MPALRFVVNTKYFHALFYSKKYFSNTTFVIFIFKLLHILKKAVANKRLNGNLG